ncbi:MAG: hypothetical protein JXR37_13595 [Kiritimatiellae bacterium]|nr:hypothetical protein [Kiritimatiellia bacterium]
MSSRTLTTFLCLSVFVRAVLNADARICFVDAAKGRDSNDGSAAAPFATPQRGVDAAMPGDTVHVRPGVYRGTVVFLRSGEPGRPIVLEGEKGAILDGGEVVTGWTPAPEVGEGVFKKTLNRAGWPVPHLPCNLTWDNKLVLRINDGNMKGGAGFDRLKAPREANEWDHIEALYGTKDKVTYLRFRDGRDPNTGEVAVGPHWQYDSSATVRVIGKRHIVVRGFTIRNRTVGVALRRGASDNVVENNTILGGKWGVLVGFCWWNLKETGLAADPEHVDVEPLLCHRNHIRRNAITLDFIAKLAPIPALYASRRVRRWHWEQFKVFGDNDREAVALYNAGHDNRVYGNHIFEHWGGIQDWSVGKDWQSEQFSIPRSELCRRLNVYDNSIHDILDDALEPTGGGIDCEWHDNLLYRANVTIRQKGIRQGPTYIYRNRCAAPSATAVFYFADTRARIYFYHNSFSALRGITMPTRRAARAANTWWVNNIFSATELWAPVKSADTMQTHFDYNLCAGSHFRQGVTWQDQPKANWLGGHNTILPDKKLWKDGDLDLTLPADSPARGKGIDLSKPWTLDGERHPPLPGMTPGYFKGARPDPGAAPYPVKNEE